MEIRKARKEEYHLIQKFIDTYWKKGHALVKSKILLDFQHLENETYNYYIGIENGEVWALLGYIPLSHYDSALPGKNAWGAIWKIRDNCPYPGLGLELMDTLLANESADSFAAIGISQIAKKIYRLYGMETGVLNQYYIANNNLQDTRIAQNLTCVHPAVPAANGWQILPISDLNTIPELTSQQTPQKSRQYYIDRYQNHPIFKYIFWGIYHESELTCVWVLRRVIANAASALRIMDMYGPVEGLPSLHGLVQEILQSESCEYVDCLNYGIDCKFFEHMGFIKHDVKSSQSILPQHFEPFEPRNVPIEIAFTSKKAPYIVFKGDSDQDRPNIL